MPKPSKSTPKSHVEPTFDLLALPDRAAAELLKSHKIALLPAEARHFQTELGRPLTLTELTIFSIQGSEHCSYRSSRRHLKNLPTKGAAVILGPGEDAGVVEIAREPNGKKWGLVIGHESHNHPSQVVPYEGAATGVGGCVRDIVCMGARAIGVLDPLRFGDPKKHLTKNLLREAVRGIAGYGNPLGVPSLGGDLEFDASFDANCLVNVVALGVLRADELIHSFVPAEAADAGYEIIVVGKPTDQSGFGGAAFASGDLGSDSEANKGAVQEPNPFLERHILVATYDLFAELKKAKKLDKVSFKDMGAGGNVCASVEQVEPRGFGATIDLEKVHTTAASLPPHVIACSETQERFCWICHPSLTQQILSHYNEKWDLPGASVGARASVVGRVTRGNYVLKYRGATLVDAPAKVLTEGLSYNRPFKRAVRKHADRLPDFAQLDLAKVLKQVLGHANVASRAPVFEQYDKEVQGQTAVDAGLGGPAIFCPLVHTAAPAALKKTGVAIGLGGSSTLGAYSAELQAAHAVAESVTAVVAAGATPLALTDCLNYGNPERPAQMAELVDGIAGLRKAAEIFGTPFVSGNVSLYNQVGGSSVNPSAIVACVGRLADAAAAVPAKFQTAGNALVLVGSRSARLGGSVFLNALGKAAAQTFALDLPALARASELVLAAAQKKIVASARDLHRGGLLTAAAESAFETALGVQIELPSGNPRTAFPWLFAENPGYLLEIAPENLQSLAELAGVKNVEIAIIGEVLPEPQLLVFDEKKVWLDTPRATLEKVWAEGLRRILVG